MLAFGPNPARRAALAGTVLASLLACAALLCASMTAAEAQKLDPWLEGVLSRIDKELAKPTPPTETLLGSPVEMARLTYENAVRAYNGRKVRTKADFNYVMSLRAKYVAAYKHERTPPPEYDRSYTDGELTIKRVEITGETTTEAMRPLCLSNYNNPVGCAVGRRGLGAWCTIYIVSDAYLKKHSAVMKVLGVTYESVLRHEIAHCNGWPADHPHTKKPVEAREMRTYQAEDHDAVVKRIWLDAPVKH